MTQQPHICDCGARYSSLAALEACQIGNHGQPRHDPLRDAAPDMLEALKEWEAVAEARGDITDSFCEICGRHAPKDEHGFITGEELEEARPPPRRRKPKAELRAEAEAALAEYRGRITVALECRACGHQGTARLPQDRASVTVYCSECGTVLD